MSDLNKCWGTKMGPLFESPPRLLLKSGLQPLARYGTHQETLSRWLGEGPLFESDLNKRRGGGAK